MSNKIFYTDKYNKKIQEIIIDEVREQCEFYSNEYNKMIDDHHIFFKTKDVEVSRRAINEQLIKQDVETTIANFKQMQYEDYIS